MTYRETLQRITIQAQDELNRAAGAFVELRTPDTTDRLRVAAVAYTEALRRLHESESAEEG